MKNISFKTLVPASLLGFFLLISVVACKKDKAKDLSGTFSLKQDGPYEFKQNDHVKATFTLTAIKDSRCPIAANCIDAGYGMLSLKIKDLNIGKEQAITLYIGQASPKNGKNVAKISLNGTGYLLMLKDIEPFPQVYIANPKPISALLSLTKI